MLAEQTRKGEGRENVRACCSAAARPTTKVDHWLRRPRRSRASSASRSAARSGGTRSRASSTATSSASAAGADRRQLPALRAGLRRGGAGARV
jgi:hypothetical protein